MRWCPPRISFLVPLFLLGALLTIRPASAHDATALNNEGVKAAQAGRFEEGIALLRQALTRDPADAMTRRNLSSVLVDWAAELEQQGATDRAIAVLEEALIHHSHNGLAAVRLGDLHYLARGDLEAAIRVWQQAHGQVSASVWQNVANRIAAAQRDQLLERGFIAHQSKHFDLRLPATMHVPVESLQSALEAVYARLAQAFGRGPSRLTVLVYPNHDLQRLYNRRDWAIGFYDGRLRLRADDVGDEHAEPLLAHELTHAFLHQVYGAGIPIWVHEGYAQHQEGLREMPPEWQRLEARLRARTDWVPLKWLDRHFEQPSGSQDIARAYLQARVVVEELIQRYGERRFHAFLARVGERAVIEAAYDEVFAPSQWSKADRGHFE